MADIYGQLVKAQFENSASDLSSVAGLVYYNTGSGLLKYYDGVGAAWRTLVHLGTALSNPMTTTGDIIYSSDNSGTPARKALGTANQVLGVNSGAMGLEYKTLSVGTSGTDFAIAHSAGGVAFNLPDASASNRGAVTTGTQTFAGTKTFNGGIVPSAAQSTLSTYSAWATFTPTLAENGSNAGTLNSSSTTHARWSRIGDIVHVEVRFTSVNISGGALPLQITLPVAAKNAFIQPIWVNNAGTEATGRVVATAASTTLVIGADAAGTAFNNGTNSQISIMLAYEANA